MAARKNGQPAGEAEALRILAESTVQRGFYSNLVLISHTDEEFILDFVMRFRGDAQLVSRIILSPKHAERLASALSANIEKRAQGIQEPPPSKTKKQASPKRKRKSSSRKRGGA